VANSSDVTVAELHRSFVDFRQEVRDELKWLRRMLIGILASAILSSALSSMFVAVTQ
jgi:hypothetical protein